MTVQKPYKLLLVTTENIKNSELEEIFSKNIETLANLFRDRDYIEINRNEIIMHQERSHFLLNIDISDRIVYQ